MTNSLLIRSGALLVTTLLGLTACAPDNIREAVENQKPRVSVTQARLTGLNFDQVDMLFTIQVDNPNPVGIKLAALDYDLQLADHSFASGTQKKGMKLQAAGRSDIELPLSLGFKEIYQGLGNLAEHDEIPYQLTTGLSIDVPLLGKLRYPVTTKGKLPLPKLPKISLQSLSLDQLSLSGATLALNLAVENPNGFNIALDKLAYDFKVNGKSWLNGNRSSLGTITQQQKNQITLPINLNFLEMGSSLYTLLGSHQELDYSLSGKLNASSDLPLLRNFDMPISSSGKVKLQR